MDAVSGPRPKARTRWAGAAAAACVIVFASSAAVVLASHVEVTDPVTEETRTCGSAFDSVVDRAGWEIWWARDLDEPDPTVRTALVRTSRCPDAVNGRLVVAGVLGGLAILAAAVVAVTLRMRQRSLTVSEVHRRILRLGRQTSWLGAVLTLAGMLALVVMVADADSTLFLYVDRLVVALVGLIVLVPTIALFVIGRALTILGGVGDRGDGTAPLDDEGGHGAGGA
jgi:hypothetical protein